MKTINLKFILVSLFAMLAVGCGFFGGLPSDESMEENFRAHEADFKKLTSMFKEDANLGHVNEAAAYLPGNERDSPKAELSPQRLDEYHRLFKQTGVKIILRGDDRIFFGSWGGSDSTGILGIDYMYVENPPSPLIDSRDQLDKLPDDQQRKTGYKKIADNWYLRFRKTKRISDSTVSGSD
jgi:hypothetical protein